MTGYSGTPLWKKLGYKPGLSVWVEGAPATYAADLQLPPDISVEQRQHLEQGVELVHLFVDSKRELLSRLRVLRRQIDPAGAIWISWPKRSSGLKTDITDNVVRDVALPLGFVDIKVCAVNDVWSGLKLVIRKELR